MNHQAPYVLNQNTTEPTLGVIHGWTGAISSQSGFGRHTVSGGEGKDRELAWI